MAIGPLLPGRLPNSLAATRLQANLATINRNLVRLQDQAATGQKFFLPSDSPSAALQTMALQRTIERQTYYSNNITTDQALLTSASTALDSTASAANQAKSIVLQGLGEGSSPEEKQALALQVSSLITSVINDANSQLQGRYVFGGSQTGQLPFEIVDDGIVRYNGDAQSLQTNIGQNLQLSSNYSGEAAFSALSTPITSDVNPALSLDTKVADLLGGRGFPLGTLRVTVDDGVNPPATQDVDLTGSDTVRDIQTRLEAAFPPGTLTVGIDPANHNALQLSAAAAVTVQDLTGSSVAQRLGIAGGPAATITGSDLDPRLTLQTKLSDLNGGAGLANPANSFVISNGNKTAAIDVSSATTVEDLFNQINLANIDVTAGINDAGNGIAISTRLSGATFSISENGGSTATDLGIRTMGGGTLLSDLNRGAGIGADANTPLNIHLADGTTYSLDLTGKRTVQDVIDAINALGNPNLTAGLATTGNGIRVTDTSAGSANFSIDANAVGLGLGISGSVNGNGTLAGTDVNPQETHGILNVLLNLKKALEAGNNQDLGRIDSQVDRETLRINLARGDVGNRLKFLDDINNRLKDQDVTLQSSLSDLFDADMTTVITQLTQQATVLQATLKIAASTQQLSLLNYL